MRDAAGQPLVIRNAPLLRDGTPMPTRYWLVGSRLRRAVDRLEAAGGVRQAQAMVAPADLEAAHRAYAAERDAALPGGWAGPRPAGGVGGTRQGVKCLHAHYAWFLAGGDDPVGRWVDQRVSADQSPAPGAPAAAIDCGTNSTRLLVGAPGGPPLERLHRITRLGRGVDRDRRLAPDAVARTLDALRDYRALIDRHGVGRVRMTATSAARDAANREDLFGPAELIVGVRPELLDGHEEGRLSFLGATAELDPAAGPWLVVDVGGGSTELIAGPGPGGGPVAAVSLDVGCVRVTERFLPSDPPRPDELERARRHVAELLERALAGEPALAGPPAMIGLAGTVSTLAAVDQGVESQERRYVHHHRLAADRVEALLSALASTDAAGRRRMAGMEAERADVIVGGTLVLAEVMAVLGHRECLTSEADILDGLLLDGSVAS